MNVILTPGFPLVSWIAFLPLVGVMICLILPRAREEAIRRTALITSLATFALSLFLPASMNFSSPALQLVEKLPWIPQWSISYAVGVDGLSMLLVLLTTFLSPIAILSSWSAIKDRVKEYYIFMLLLEVGMVGVFITLDLFLFYIFWEFTLVPMYFLIGIWGGHNRVYAAIKFFLYTMAGSLLMLLAILYLGFTQGTFYLPDLVAGNAAFGGSMLLFAAFAIAFAIKVPMWPLHSWLPDAHTEAPTAGSVILAGVLLKMGTYGFLRFNLPLFPQASAQAAPVMAVLAIIGIIYGAIVSLPQPDVKKLVAYSSVSHLGFVMLGIFSLNPAGIQGAILQMVNHGLSTGALFLLIGFIYERRHTRELAQFGGLWTIMPIYAAMTLVATLSSMGLPGLNGFVGEFTILLGSFSSVKLGAVAGAAGPGNAWIYTAFAASGVILAAVYLLWMFQRMFLGPVTHEENRHLVDLNAREQVVMVPLLVMMFVIGLFPAPFLNTMQEAVSHLVGMIR
jgi:NADH-quinone oxidoreductase subunit M